MKERSIFNYLLSILKSLLFHCFKLNLKFYNNMMPPSTIFLPRIINSKEYIIHKVWLDYLI